MQLQLMPYPSSECVHEGVVHQLAIAAPLCLPRDRLAGLLGCRSRRKSVGTLAAPQVAFAGAARAISRGLVEDHLAIRTPPARREQEERAPAGRLEALGPPVGSGQQQLGV